MTGWKAVTAAGLLNLAMAAALHAQPPTAPALPTPPESTATPPTYTITLHTRSACVTPHAHKLARAEGGFIDVTTPSTNVLATSMTGTAAANSYLGCTGSAVEKFQLVQDFEITCSDPRQKLVALALDTSLVGFVRSKGRAEACVRRAEVCVTPVDVPGVPMTIAYPPLCVEGTGGQLCNQHLPPLEVPALPVGRYTLTATFVLDTRASGVCDSHSVADFSPDTALPPEWVRTRDPFQGVAKKSFGFSATLTATAPTPRDAIGAPGRRRRRRPPGIDAQAARSGPPTPQVTRRIKRAPGRRDRPKKSTKVIGLTAFPDRDFRLEPALSMPPKNFGTSLHGAFFSIPRDFFHH